MDIICHIASSCIERSMLEIQCINGCYGIWGRHLKWNCYWHNHSPSTGYSSSQVAEQNVKRLWVIIRLRDDLLRICESNRIITWAVLFPKWAPSPSIQRAEPTLSFPSFSGHHPVGLTDVKGPDGACVCLKSRRVHWLNWHGWFFSLPRGQWSIF